MSDTIKKESVSAGLSVRMIQAAEAEAKKIGKSITIAVTDEGGHVVALLRMDGAPPVSATVAQLKAKSVVMLPRATHELWEYVKSDPMLTAGVPLIEGVTVLGGGYPVMHNDQVIGGIAVSGASYQEDMQIAQAGLAAFKR